MAAYTELRDHEKNQPSGDEDLDRALARAREELGDDFQVIVTRYPDSRKFLFWTIPEPPHYALYVNEPNSGIFTWRMLVGSYNPDDLFNYLSGLGDGAANAKRQLA